MKNKEQNDEQNDEIVKYFKLDKTQDLYKMIQEYTIKNGTSPFESIKVKTEPGTDSDTEEIQLDINKNFETKITEAFDDLDSVLTDYITAMMSKVMDDIKDGKVKVPE